MEITSRGLVTVVHGMLFGGFFLLAIYGLWFEERRSSFIKESPALADSSRRWERVYLIVVALAGWSAVLSGAYVIYPWYRATAPSGAGLAGYPQRLLMSSALTSGWHTLGMEWKEHTAWMSAILLWLAVWLGLARLWRLKTVSLSRINAAAFTLLALGLLLTFPPVMDRLLVR